MFDQVILEDTSGKLISYERLSPVLTKGQVRRTLSQHHYIVSFDVIGSVAKVVLATKTPAEPTPDPLSV